MNLSFHESVEFDLADGVEFYDRQEPGVGEYFQESILADAIELQKDYGIHSKKWGCFRKLGTIFPFAIYYDIAENSIIVYAILDMRREPSWIRNEITNRISQED